MQKNERIKQLERLLSTKVKNKLSARCAKGHEVELGSEECQLCRIEAAEEHVAELEAELSKLKQTILPDDEF